MMTLTDVLMMHIMIVMNANEFTAAVDAKVAARQADIMREAGEMVADGRLADDYAAAVWISDQQDRIAANPWG